MPLLTLATYNAAFVLKYLGFVDLSLAAAERCHDAAADLASPEWVGLAGFARLHTLPPESHAISRRLAVATADALQPQLRTPEARQIYGMSIAFEAGEPARAVRLASDIDTTKIYSISRRVAFHMDLGAALAATRRHDAQALAEFVHAERLAPQRVRLSPVVRETVGAMLRRARADAGGAQLRAMAARMGVDSPTSQSRP